MPWRSLQCGLGGPAVASYVDRWVLAIADVTDLAATLRSVPPAHRHELLPDERPYPLTARAAEAVGASPG